MYVISVWKPLLPMHLWEGRRMTAVKNTEGIVIQKHSDTKCHHAYYVYVIHRPGSYVYVNQLLPRAFPLLPRVNEYPSRLLPRANEYPLRLPPYINEYPPRPAPLSPTTRNTILLILYVLYVLNILCIIYKCFY